MPRSAATKSCSTIRVSPVELNCSCAGETVPQQGQTSAFCAGLHLASAPQAGQENFFWATASGTLALQEFVQRRYNSWNTGIGEKIEKGKVGFKDLEAYILKKGDIEPNASGRQELLENLINEFI